jgi:hypothetical protein
VSVGTDVAVGGEVGVGAAMPGKIRSSLPQAPKLKHNPVQKRAARTSDASSRGRRLAIGVVVMAAPPVDSPFA